MAEVSFARDDNVINLNDAIELPPRRPPSINPGIGVELLFNRNKVSQDVLSMCSDDEDDVQDLPPNDADLDDEEGSGYDSARGAGGMGMGYGENRGPRTFAQAQQSSQTTDEINREKRELLWQFDNMSSKGIKVPTFTMNDGLPEMKDAMARIVKEREQEASVRFQRKAVQACVSGIEFLNARFNPADVHLDGWSETVNDSLTIGDYDDIFTELAEKYKMSGKRFAPELRLMFSLGGSALMFHLSHTMLKNSAIPGIDAVLKNNPQLMRQVASAAAKMGGSVGRMGGASGQPQGGGGGGFDLGSMFNAMSGLGSGGQGFGSGNGNGGVQSTRPVPPPPHPPPPQAQSTMRGPTDMNDLMRHLHADPTSERFEVMSVTDSEISSILDTSPDGASRRRAARGGKPKRTLNI